MCKRYALISRTYQWFILSSFSLKSTNVIESDDEAVIHLMYEILPLSRLFQPPRHYFIRVSTEIPHAYERTMGCTKQKQEFKPPPGYCISQALLLNSQQPNNQISHSTHYTSYSHFAQSLHNGPDRRVADCCPADGHKI